MEASIINNGLNLLPQWGIVGAFILIVVLLVGGFLWYICKRDAHQEKLTDRCFDVIERNTKQGATLEDSINTLAKDVTDLTKEIRLVKNVGIIK